MVSEHNAEIGASPARMAEAVAVLEGREIDLLVVDASLPDGHGEECVRTARERFPRIESVILHDSAGDTFAEDRVRKDTAVIVHKQDTVATFMRAVQVVLMVLRDREPAMLDAWLLAPQDVMSKREYEIFCGIGRGLANKEIATSLRLSPQTVETHRKAVARKIGASGSELIRKATIHVMLAASAIAR